MHIKHTKMIDTINILAMERKALRHQHAKKDHLIARLRVRIATLEQLIPIPNHAPRDKSTVTCHACGVTGHYSKKCPMKAANNAPRTGSNAVPIAQKDKSTVTCYECGTVGHYSNECPEACRIALNLHCLQCVCQPEERDAGTGQNATRPDTPCDASMRMVATQSAPERRSPPSLLTSSRPLPLSYARTRSPAPSWTTPLARASLVADDFVADRRHCSAGRRTMQTKPVPLPLF
ncbi:hypothetical protein QYE76_071022 [Lolium multiflorum]|uniref:CCHC-type domain-containing protein n=1 Tax=Lolium multiflorum TaxID=4521 RepID=A0AAD8SLA2_LOLMU|nr:hypothetical protein QYE76_071022 [Lolium multiflorum]